MKSKILAQIAFVIGALYGIGEQGAAWATLEASREMGLSNESVRIALDKLRSMFEKTYKSRDFLFLNAEENKVIHRFNFSNLNIENLVEENGRLSRIPDDLRNYVKCFTANLDDGYKLCVIVYGGLILKTENCGYVLNASYIEPNVAVRITKNPDFYVGIEEEFAGILDSIELIGEVPDGVIIGLDLTETDRKVVVDISRKNNLNRFEKYKRIKEKLEQNIRKAERQLLSVLRSISESTSEIDEGVRKKMEDLVGKLNGWIGDRKRSERGIKKLVREIAKVEKKKADSGNWTKWTAADLDNENTLVNSEKKEEAETEIE